MSNKTTLLTKLPCRPAGNLSARGCGVTSKSVDSTPVANVMVGFGDKKDKFFKPQSKFGENVQFSGQDGQNWSPPPFSGPKGFQQKLSTSSYRPSFFGHVPALVEEEFKNPEFCKSVAGLKRMLRVRARSHTDKSPVDLSGTCLSGGERQGSMMPDLVAVSQERSPGSHDGASVPGSADYDSVEHASAINVDDSSVEVLIDHAVDSTATGKRDLEDGFVAVRTFSSATAGDGNRSRLLEVIESVFPCWVTLCTNSPSSSLRVSPHARARAFCFAAASATSSDPHFALLALPALIHAHADDSLIHARCVEFRCFE